MLKRARLDLVDAHAVHRPEGQPFREEVAHRGRDPSRDAALRKGEPEPRLADPGGVAFRDPPRAGLEEGAGDAQELVPLGAAGVAEVESCLGEVELRERRLGQVLGERVAGIGVLAAVGLLGVGVRPAGLELAEERGDDLAHERPRRLPEQAVEIGFREDVAGPSVNMRGLS